MDVWKVFLQNETTIKAMCSRLACGDTWLSDDLYTEAALRWPRIIEMHPAKEERVRCLRILRLYLWKYRNKYRKRTPISFEGDLEDSHIANKLELQDEVSNVLEGLEEWQKEILLWKAEGFTLREIADWLDVCPCTVRNYLIEAMDQCRFGIDQKTTQEDAKQDLKEEAGSNAKIGR